MKMNLLVAAAAAMLAAACSQRGALVARGAPISQAEFESLLAPEPGSVAADYHAIDTALRLYGIQPAAQTATFADTRDWSVRTVHVGELVARNLALESISASGATLRGGMGDVSLARGQDVVARLIRHRVDDASLYLGRGHFDVEADAIASARAAHGLGASAVPRVVFFASSLELASVDAQGALARLGFAERDQLLDVDGSRIADAGLSAFVDALTAPGTHHVSLVRGGTTRDFVFEVHVD